MMPGEPPQALLEYRAAPRSLPFLCYEGILAGLRARGRRRASARTCS